ncbi:MAG: TraI/MobA(P) family conjugative relaxase, partial [Desulfovibrionaceae bacterium]|nr:TraI/MobA(P) family conjugative relaxase [Desulfovibrionaceae bacterium]
MISKRIFIKAENDNYARLASYIADAGPNGEKCLMHWCAGLVDGDDYREGIAEVEDVQALNTRASRKTYHLVISFRPEDESKLTPEVFRAIEERFAAALGYAEHQRHCGVHRNTAHLHMHIAYNMIHPEKLTVHKEFRDFWIRDQVCRKLETELGLSMDHGRQPAQEATRRNEKAYLIESHSGRQSFDAYVKEHRQEILHSLKTAASWQAFHAELAVMGMAIKPHGNGLVICDSHAPSLAVKASAVGRSLSFKKLQTRFGEYQAPLEKQPVAEKSRYTATPLQRSPERGKLFIEYREQIESRKARLQTIKEQEGAALAAIRSQWAVKRQELQRQNLAKKNLRRLLQLARKHEDEALAKARLSFHDPRSQVRQDIPFTTWNGFLQHKADQGNEIALAVLRSRVQAVEPEKVPALKNWTNHGAEQFSHTHLRAEQATRERELMQR